MKDELIRILNNKLADINSDIDSLVELNGKIANEQDALAYVSGILDSFVEDGTVSVMSFHKLSKDDFTRVLDILGGDVKDVFASPNCNYDGLVYLINGINDGVSLTLTDEQKNGIEYLIQKLREKKEEHNTAIDGFNLIKEHYAINDVDELKTKKEKYLSVLDELSNKDYVSNMELLTEAMEFSGVAPDKTIEILKYLLEYNAEIYESGKEVKEEPVEAMKESEEKKEVSDIPLSTDEEEPFGSFADLEAFETSEEPKEESNSFANPEPQPEETPTVEIDTVSEDTGMFPDFQFNDFVKDDFTSYGPLSFNSDVETTLPDDIASYVPIVEPEVNNTSVEEEQSDELSTTDYEPVNETSVPVDEYEAPNDTISTSDLNELLGKYGIQEDNSYLNELIVGDVKSYESILNTLKDNNIIDEFKKNSELLIEVLLNSSSEIINRVLDIIRDDLSTDNDDYVITTKIAINTIPSIFIKQGGNYDNFINNIEIFKELGLNLINLFDFSKELFVADNETIVNNLAVVRKYNININYKNAKYLLLLPNIGDRIDYYVESVYEDKLKHETFDGIPYINDFTAKLNVVTDETIKRLRYCSENGKKVFGSKPKSLTGDITNLKVNSLDITGDYLSKFFNNEFATLTGDEVREYTKLIHNSSNVGNYDDELDILEKYRDGLRYTIDGIIVSYNKVLRNYSILRSYGIDNKKALHFAICYNLVITKDEYDRLKTIIDNELGGK